MFEDSLRPTQKFYTVKEIEVQHQKDIKSGTFKLNSGGADQLALQRAMEASKQDFNQRKKEGEGKEGEPEQFFQGKGISLGQPSQGSPYMEIYDQTELKIIKLSLKDVEREPE